jgi:hypothetical protein
METYLEEMQKVLMKKEKKYENNQELKFSEDYQKVIENFTKQQQILKDCKKFYFLMRKTDEEEDSNQADTTSRAISMKRRTNSKKGTIDFENIRKESYGTGDEKVVKRPLTEEEKKYLQTWDKYSKEMDETLEEVFNEMEIMLQKLDVIDEEQDENIRLGKELGDKVDKVREDLQFTNQKLKTILTELRSPGKICADLTLAFILCIMLGVLVFVIRLYMSLEA